LLERLLFDLADPFPCFCGILQLESIYFWCNYRYCSYSN